MTLTPIEILNAYQLGLITANEARVALNFKELEPTEEKENND